ncbi:hypothetical protein [Niallia taxi]|uniref:hypothetical protein n=1 Tax=Niallia taxi TaxID=2499688 RepID=UPI002E1D7D85|nr:hypothetical protein [Niallia taxi]
MIGFVIRLSTEVIFFKKRRLLKWFHSELIVIVDCDESQGELVENILFHHFTLGVAKVK